MSIKSTHSVTREFAIEVIRKKIEDKDITDGQLEDMLELAIHNGYYNFIIVEEEQLEKMKWNNDSTYLDDIENLPEYNDVY